MRLRCLEGFSVGGIWLVGWEPPPRGFSMLSPNICKRHAYSKLSLVQSKVPACRQPSDLSTRPLRPPHKTPGPSGAAHRDLAEASACAPALGLRDLGFRRRGRAGVWDGYRADRHPWNQPVHGFSPGCRSQEPLHRWLAPSAPAAIRTPNRQLLTPKWPLRCIDWRGEPMWRAARPPLWQLAPCGECRARRQPRLPCRECRARRQPRPTCGECRARRQPRLPCRECRARRQPRPTCRECRARRQPWLPPRTGVVSF